MTIICHFVSFLVFLQSIMTMMIKFYNFIMSSKIFFIINRFANHIHRSNNLNLFLKRIIAPSIVGRNIRGLSCDIGWIFLTSNQLKKSYQNWLLFLHGFQQENNKQEKIFDWWINSGTAGSWPKYKFVSLQ